MKHDIVVLIVTPYQEGGYAGCSRNAGGTEKHKIKDLDFVITSVEKGWTNAKRGMKAG